MTHTTVQPFAQIKRIRLLQVGVVLVAFLMIWTRPAWNEASFLHEAVEFGGVSLVWLCIFGRLWSILYVGGRKNNELITVGPYSITRNPLYFFSTIGAFGTGLMFGSVVVALALGAAALAVFFVTAAKEAVYLRTKFGEAYATYERRTPLFWPNPFLYVESQDARFSPRALKSTFVDGLAFMTIFPLIEFVEYLREIGSIPSFLALY